MCQPSKFKLKMDNDYKSKFNYTMDGQAVCIITGL